MSRPDALPAARLRATLRPEALPYADSRDIPAKRVPPPQPRALAALELALEIPGHEHHVYLAGDPGLGRTYFLRQYLEPLARTRPAPPDVVYLCNFQDEDRPRHLPLPPGRGRELKTELDKAVDALRDEIPALLEQEAFLERRGALLKDFQSAKDNLYGDMESTALRMGFALTPEDDGQLTLAPRINGRALGPEEFDAMDPEEQKDLRARRDDVMNSLGGFMRQVREAERGFSRQERTLEREFAAELLAERLAPLRQAFADQPEVLTFLDELTEDILENLDKFTIRADGQCPTGPAGAPGPGGQGDDHEDWISRYEAHLFIDSAQVAPHGGAPIIVEDHPTAANLLGAIERESELGAFYTDFTLLKPGALHKANHGFLLLKAEDVLTCPTAWEGLLRALRSGLARMEDAGEHPDQVRTKTIEPEPLKLDLKVFLVGSDEVYEQLLYADQRFRKLFKIKAHLQNHVERTDANIHGFLDVAQTIIAETGLLPFGREALAGLVDHASRLAEDQTRLSLHYPMVRELMIEASALARKAGQAVVDGPALGRAQQAWIFRNNLYEEEFMTDYDREIIKVATSGTAVGRVNGLSVSFYGEYEIGLPHHIACTVGVGREGILDLEREAELGGPIHTKAMMILKSCLLGLFAYDKPLILSGSLYFEQSYAEVEGDSAAGAELAALLSALAQVPINLSYAFTGAVNQSGGIMAVGGVNRKIEGFFEVCRRRGLTGHQGVILPADNVVNLMLSPEVVAAVERGDFAVYPVRSIEQAMELLTGLPAGTRQEDGSFTPGSLYARVDARLAQLAQAAEKYARLWRT